MIALRTEEYRIASARELDIEKTFECGQCFRWNADAGGVYTGVAMGRAARVRSAGGQVYVRSDAPESFPAFCLGALEAAQLVDHHDGEGPAAAQRLDQPDHVLPVDDVDVSGGG